MPVKVDKPTKNLASQGLLVVYYIIIKWNLDLIYDGREQMRYLSVTEIAKKWNVSDRSVRNYCAKGRVNGAFLTGKTWNIPENAEKPERSNKKKEQPITLLDILPEWNNEKGYLTDTCLAAQDKYKTYLDYFRIAYDK